MKPGLVIFALLFTIPAFGQAPALSGEPDRTDSLTYDMAMRADIYIHSTKVMPAYILVKNQKGETVSRTEIEAPGKHRVAITELPRGLYYLEAHDRSGMIFSDNFIRK